MSVNYYRTMLAYGIKLMVTLLLAGIGLDILHNVQAQAGQGWGTDLMTLGKALIASAILLGIIGKAPGAVAGITGVSTNGVGGHGWGSFLAGVGTAAAVGSGAAGAAVQGGKQLARRCATPSNKGRRYPGENREPTDIILNTGFLFGFGACLLLWSAAEVSWSCRKKKWRKRSATKAFRS